ncbi:hypothetical protein EON78_07135 [bacterium]|nr:MAG: hypothetical protein EON78_07135 [bacterium]
MLFSLSVLITNCAPTPANSPVSTATPTVTESTSSSAPVNSGSSSNPVTSASPSVSPSSVSTTPTPTSSQSSGGTINPVSSNSLNLQSDFLKVSYVDYYSTDLKWTSVNGAKSYKIYQDGKLIADNIKDLGYSVRNLTPNTDYTFEIIAVSDTGESNKALLKVRTFIPSSSSSGSNNSSNNSGQPYVNPNYSPVITSVTASNETLSGLGYTTLLTAVASDDNNNLSYSWSTLGGSFGTFTNTTGVAATIGNPIRWTAPTTVLSTNGATGGFDTYTIQLSVTDGVNTAVVRTISIKVDNRTSNVNLST